MYFYNVCFSYSKSSSYADEKSWLFIIDYFSELFKSTTIVIFLHSKKKGHKEAQTLRGGCEAQ